MVEDVIALGAEDQLHLLVEGLSLLEGHVGIDEAGAVKRVAVDGQFLAERRVGKCLGGRPCDFASSRRDVATARRIWRADKLRPLCVFDSKRMDYKTKVTKTMSWNDIPTCKESGLDVEYLMLRGIFMPGGVTQDQVNFYIDLLKKVRETPDWKEFTEQAAFNQSFMTGPEYVKWLTDAETMHKGLMEKAGFLAKK